MKIVANIIGILAVGLFVLSYQMKTRRGIVLCNVVSRGLYVMQYLLLFAFEGAVLDILGMVVSLVAQRKDAPWIRRHLIPVVLCAEGAILIAGLALYRSPLSLLPMVGVMLHTGAFWLTEERKIRIVSFLGSPFWFVYNAASGAYGSAIGDVLTMVSISAAIVRYDWRGRKSE